MQFGDETRHLFLEGVAVVFDFLGADVAARREDVAVGGDFGGGGDFLKIGVGQLTVDAVDESAELAGVDEESVLAAVAETAFGVGVLVLR